MRTQRPWRPAGVFSIVLECVPSGVAKAVTEAVGVPILGIGAGPYVDCQVLFTHDLLDMYGDFNAPASSSTSPTSAARW